MILDAVEAELLGGGPKTFQKFRKQKAAALLHCSGVLRVAPAVSLEVSCPLQPL